nr:type II toxin-antitoxin system HipA family toxin [Microvirga tunisiensis]
MPGASEPVVAGRLYQDGSRLSFNYGRSYLSRDDAIPIYAPELPLRPGAHPPATGLSMPACLRDAAPDAWGRRVILNRILGLQGKDVDVERLDELTYALESGSDRIGALDFQASPDVYVPRRAEAASLEELLTAAERVEQGIPITPELEQALFHGSALGGARPKALVDDGNTRLIAKFSSSSDVYNVVKGEFIAMRLAALAGLKVAPVRLVRAAGRDILLVERFDRVRQADGWTRRAMVSALTLFGLDEMMGRYASYEDLATIIRQRFEDPVGTLRELFGRLTFNVLCGNIDDHARNHAAFWDGQSLTLTPAYDICPQGRAGNEASQAMLIFGQNRMSRLEVCLQAAGTFLLNRAEAEKIITDQVKIIRAKWEEVCDEAALSEVDRRLFWRRQFLNPYAFEGASKGIASVMLSDNTGG